MLNPDTPLGRLTQSPASPGGVVWIGVRPTRKAPLHALDAVEIDEVQGLVGDHYVGRSRKRQITLIASEHLAAIASYLGRAEVSPLDLRRNIVTRGINLLALRDAWVQIGAAVLEPTGECHPCSRMEAALGPGGYSAVRGHGGLTARVVRGGRVRVGDAIVRLPRNADLSGVCPDI
jgi:MOSC domain-containing protein YiiM